MTPLRRFLELGPFELSLSVGWFGFFAHLGFLQALRESGYQPSSVRGASSGAIAAAVLASPLAFDQAVDVVFSVRRSDFWDPGLGRGLLRGEKLRQLLRERLALGSFDSTRLDLSFVSWNETERCVETLRHGDPAAAVHASVAVFPLFMPARVHQARFVDVAYRDPLALGDSAPSERRLVHELCSDSRPGLEAAETRGPQLFRHRFSDRIPLGPFRLARGPAAFEEARCFTLRALD